jgi:hypothetical protein
MLCELKMKFNDHQKSIQNIADTKHLQDLHLQLQDLLAGYIDNMLDDRQVEIIEAHLSGCEACRQDVKRQQLLHKRLDELPIKRMPAQLHQQLDDALMADSLNNIESSTKVKRSYLPTFSMPQNLQALLWSFSGWGLALTLALVIFLPTLNLPHHNAIPMVADVLAEYSNLNKTPFPKLAKNLNSPAPASWPSAHIISSWETQIGGDPATAYAVRNGDNIVFQYYVTEKVFFRNHDVRIEVANTGNYQFKTGKLTVLALPLKEAGLLLVSTAKGMPSTDKIILNTTI